MGLTVFLPLTNLQKSSKMKNLRRNNKKTKTFQFLTNQKLDISEDLESSNRQ